MLIFSLEAAELLEAPEEHQGCLDQRHLEPEGLVAHQNPRHTNRRGNLHHALWGRNVKSFMHYR